MTHTPGGHYRRCADQDHVRCEDNQPCLFGQLTTRTLLWRLVIFDATARDVPVAACRGWGPTFSARHRGSTFWRYPVREIDLACRCHEVPKVILTSTTMTDDDPLPFHVSLADAYRQADPEKVVPGRFRVTVCTASVANTAIQNTRPAGGAGNDPP